MLYVLKEVQQPSSNARAQGKVSKMHTTFGRQGEECFASSQNIFTMGEGLFAFAANRIGPAARSRPDDRFFELAPFEG
jgi:hypothetical protein